MGFIMATASWKFSKTNYVYTLKESRKNYKEDLGQLVNALECDEREEV